MATLKQKLAVKKIIENGGVVSRGMRAAGYSKETAANPKNLTDSKGWQELMNEYFPEQRLAKVLDEGLSANRVISAIGGKQATGATTDFIEVPDHGVRHKFLETGLKLHGKMKDVEPEDSEIKILITIDTKPE